ncbi:SusF/SusE family outer membrane protein [Sphingobacterium lactis]|uniref:SusF/SusE family outer membrane protein n=1 Tax=Sphingobacterium lactis TaxID=797291 RepID=UPI003EC564A9
MKLKFKHIMLLMLSVGILGFQACKKVEHGIDDQIVSINEGTASSVQVGKPLSVGFLSNNVSNFTFSIVKAEGGDALFTQEMTFPGDSTIIEREFDLQSDASWVGEALLKITYQAGGQTVEKTKPITFLESNPVMYIVGGSIGAGWEPTLAVPMQLYDAESKVKFQTFQYITVDGSGFKFLPTNINWEDGYGKGATAGSLLQSNDAGNVEVPADGFYRVRMDAEKLTYELLKTTWGIIGSATAGDWNTDTPMTFAGGKGTYTWKITTALMAGELKFRANNDWGINLGGTLDNLVDGGPNLKIDAAGTYDIELNLLPTGYTAKITKK